MNDKFLSSTESVPNWSKGTLIATYMSSQTHPAIKGAELLQSGPIPEKSVINIKGFGIEAEATLEDILAALVVTRYGKLKNVKTKQESENE